MSIIRQRKNRKASFGEIERMEQSYAVIEAVKNELLDLTRNLILRLLRHISLQGIL